MSLDERSTFLLTKLVNATDLVTVDQVTEQLGISKRTVHYDLKKINDWLEDNKLPIIQTQQGMGYYLPEQTKENVPNLMKELKEWQYHYSQTERVTLIGIELLTNDQSIFMKDFMERTKVSRGTVSKDLKLVIQLLEDEELNLQFERSTGYVVEGKEENKRRLLSRFLTEVLTNEQLTEMMNVVYPLVKNGEDYIYSNLIPMKQIIMNVEPILKVELTDDTIQVLAIQLVVLLQRLKGEHRIQLDPDEKEAVSSTREFDAATRISEELESQFKLTLSTDEICFITMHLLGSRVNYSEVSAVGNLEIEKLREVVSEIVHEFQIYACILFEQRKELENALFLHLKPTYYRLKYNVPITNELTASVQQEYPDVFSITKRAIWPVESMTSKKLPDDEIAYLAMHFGAWMQKEELPEITVGKAIIVCEKGIGTSNILKGQLEKLLTNVEIVGTVSKRQFINNHYDINYVFSTSPLHHETLPVLTVSPILTQQDKEKILHWMDEVQSTPNDSKAPTSDIVMELVKKHGTIRDEEALRNELNQLFDPTPTTLPIERFERPMLNDLLHEETIQFASHTTDWKEAIRTAASPLLTKEQISSTYIDAMIKNVEELGPYVVIAPGIAIPHARPEEGVNTVGMSLLRLDETVPFSDKDKHQVKLLIVLAAVDNETHLKALAQLSDLLSEEENLDIIYNSTEKEDIIKLVSKYSN
ncbi:BglG family transcription antiterminator [Guptibacillus algicola]|uniref:BglG family transcription antiterminator n=1 Tax=Guptibacillus algicola TaxID=225844 RepID=UPI001CD6A49D|nr:BglG family transcription antiterminator [Alkalihalobacillus algicola]MCA0986550.1 BglG family transcription antiterminator [Alkalihalobacillus algicola]